MSKLRYRQVKFKQLDRGSGQVFYDENNPRRFNTSEGLIPNKITGHLELSPDALTEYGISSAEVNPAQQPVMCMYPFGTGVRQLILAYDPTADIVKMYRQIGYADPSACFSFPADTSSPYLTVYYRGEVLTWFDQGGTTKYYFSINDGDGFTIRGWTYAEPRGFKVARDGTLYIWTDDEIVSTTDGITWTLCFDASGEDYNITRFEELDGEFYATVGFYNLYNFLLRFNDDFEFEILHTFDSGYAITMKRFNERLIIATSKYGFGITFFEYDKAEIKVIAYYDVNSISSMNFMCSDDDFIYFVYNSKEVLFMNKKNAVYKLETTSDNVVDILKYKAELLIITTNTTSHIITTLFYTWYEAKDYKTTGHFTTPALNKRHAPAYIILKHAPLGDNATITIKAKQDGEATFATTILTNTVNDSVRTVVNLKSLLNECDTIEFEVTLADSSANGEIENLEIFYLYQSSGLENSK